MSGWAGATRSRPLQLMVVCWCIAYIEPRYCGAQHGRQLPESESYPRERVAFQEYSKSKGVLESHGDGLVPESLDLVKERMTWWETRFLADDVTIDQALVEEMLDELYFDSGDATLNAAFQHSFVQAVLRPAGKWPRVRLPDGLRTRLAEGMLRYVQEGGANWVPFARADTAAALRAIAGSDEVMRAHADALLADALVWADDVGDVSPATKRSVFDAAEKRWGTDYRFQAYALANRMPALPDKAENLPKAYLAAVDAINRAMPSEQRGEASRGEWPRRAKEADEGARARVRPESLEHDLTARFMVLLRAIAESPQATAEMIEFVNRSLVEVARDERLKNDVHCTLWENAIKSLGPQRVSGTLKQAVERLVSSKRDSVAGAAARRVLSTLKQSSATGGQPR